MADALEAAVLAGDARAWGRVADRVRARGGRYRDAYEVVCIAFAKAKRAVPTLEEFEQKMLEADALESSDRSGARRPGRR